MKSDHRNISEDTQEIQQSSLIQCVHNVVNFAYSCGKFLTEILCISEKRFEHMRPRTYAFVISGNKFETVCNSV